MADDDKLIVDVTLDTSNVLPQLEQIWKQAGALSKTELKAAVEGAFSNVNFNKFIGSKNGGEQLDFVKKFAAGFKDVSKNSAEGAQIAAQAWEAVSKKLLLDFKSAGNAKGLAPYVQSQIKLIQGELNKNSIEAKLQLKVDKASEAKALADLKAFEKQASEIANRANQSVTAARKAQADFVNNNKPKLDPAIVNETIAQATKAVNLAYDAADKLSEKRHQEQLARLRTKRTITDFGSNKPSIYESRDILAKTSETDTSSLDALARRQNAQLSQLNRQAELDQKRQDALLKQRQQLARIGQNDFLNFLSPIKNETARTGNASRDIGVLKDYLKNNKANLSDAQKRSLTGLIAGYEGRTSRQASTDYKSSVARDKADYKDAVSARLQEIGAKRLFDPNYSLKNQFRDLEALSLGIGVDARNKNLNINDVLSKTSRQRLLNQVEKARKAMEEAEAKQLEASNPFFQDPKHIEQVKRLRENQANRILSNQLAKDNIVKNPVKSIFDDAGKYRNPLAENTTADLDKLRAEQNRLMTQDPKAQAQQQAIAAAQATRAAEAQKQAVEAANNAAKQQFLNTKRDLTAGRISPQQGITQLQQLLGSNTLGPKNTETVLNKIAQLEAKVNKGSGTSESGKFSSVNLQNALLTLGFSSLAIATNNLARKMVDASASIELAQRRISTVIKDPKQSEQYFNFLRNYERKTAYELPDVLEAGTAFATQTRQLARAGLGKESGLRLAGELGSLNPNAGIVEGQRAISRIIAGDPNGLEILRSKFAITNEILKEGGARVSDQGVSLQGVKNRRLVIAAIDKFINETTKGKGAENLNQTLSGRFSTLESQIFTSMANVMDLLSPKIKTVVNWLISLLQTFDNMPNSIKEMLGSTVLLSAGFFSITAGIGGLTIVLNGLKTAFAALEAAMTAALAITEAEATAELANAAAKTTATVATEAETVAEAENAIIKKRSFLATPVSTLFKGAGAVKNGSGIGALLSYLGIGGIGLGALGLGAAAGVGTALYENYQNKEAARVKKEEIDSFLGVTGSTADYNPKTKTWEKRDVLGRGAQYERDYLNNGQQAYFEATADTAFRYGNSKDILKVQEEAKTRKRRLETVLGYQQARLKDTPEGTEAYKYTEGKIKQLEIAIGNLGDIADPTAESLKDLGEKIQLIQTRSALGNNDSFDQIQQIRDTEEYKRLKAQLDNGGKFSTTKDEADWANVQRTIKELTDKANQSRVELNLAQKSVRYAGKGGASYQDRIDDLVAKQAGITGFSREDDIKRIQLEAQIKEEAHKRDLEFNKNRVESVKRLKGEEKARIQEINLEEQRSLVQIGKNEEQAKLIRAKARQDRLDAHLDMLNKLLDMEQKNIQASLDIQKSQRDRAIENINTGKDISSMGEQFMSAKGRLENLTNVINAENQILKIKKEQTAETIKGIKKEASDNIAILENDLKRGGLSKEGIAKKKQAIELAKRKRDEDIKVANQNYTNEERKTKANQNAETVKRKKDQDKETIDQKLAILEQGKAELEYTQQKDKNEGRETEFSRVNNLQESFELEKKILELKEKRAESELPLEGAEVEKDNLRRKLRLDVLNLQQQYVAKLKEGTGELERQNQILELQKKIQERPSIYGIEDLNQRMKDESDLFRLKAGFGQGGKSGKGPYPGYGPKPYNGVDRQPGNFTFGDTSTPTDLMRQQANDVFGRAGEAVKRDAQGRIIKVPMPAPSKEPLPVQKLIQPITINLDGKTIGKDTKETDVNSLYSNMNHDVKPGGKGSR